MIKRLYKKELSEELREDYKRSDWFMLNLIFIHWILVSTLSAYSYDTYMLGFIGGGMLFLITLIAYKYYSGTAIFRIMVSIILMTYTIISIQQNLGRIEMHFHVFVALSFLTVYKDLVPATIASIYIIIHHLLFTYLQLHNISLFDTQIMIFNYGCGFDIAFLHAFYVIFEWIILYKIITANRDNFNEIHLYKNKLKSSNITLQESLNNFKELFGLTTEAIIIFDENKNAVDLNIAAEKLFGYAREEFVGKNMFDFIPEYEVEKIKNAVSKTSAKPYEVDLYKKDGSTFPTLTGGIDIIRNEKIWRMSTIQDLTDIKNREKALFKSEKMASMGEMIGNIAHQWRQPLSVISSASTGIKLEKEFDLLTDDDLIKKCDLINSNAQYLSKTIDDFKNFIKGDRTKELFNLSSDINSFLHLVESSIKNHNINVTLDLSDDIEIYGYENELSQCLINIFNNAKDILNEKQTKEKLIFISTSQKDNTAIIKIKDNGGGIAEDILPKIFEPYFTTKHKTQGTGLGLHMTYNLIVDGMKGSIEANNKEFEYNGKKYLGAEMIISLPIND